MTKADKTSTLSAHILPAGADLEPIMRQMKAIAAASADTLLLAAGPPHPDFLLLELCGDALHFAKAANAVQNHLRDGPPKYTTEAALVSWGKEHKIVVDDYEKKTNEVTQRLRRAKKIKASTPAGIYAKALLVRCSKTGATELAMSLATDLVDCPALRESLWPAFNNQEGG